MVRVIGMLDRTRRVARAPLAALSGIAALVCAASAWAAEPRPWEMDFQPAATPVMQRLEAFHDELLVIISLITAFVMGLLLYVIVRFRAARNPVPSRTTHYTVIELIWTVAPVLILVIIAIPSFKLMYYMDRVPDAQMTVKVTGNQWYWSYAYPDQGDLSFNSTVLPDSDLKPGQKRLLEVDNPLVVPTDTTVRVQVTSKNVIHSWFVPSFGVQEYAMPGRLNEAWFRVEHQGIYRGQCNQICGLNHAQMPIVVEAVSKDAFQRWLVEAKKKFAGEPTAQHVAALRAPTGN